MKRVFFTLTIVALTFFSFSQQVPRNMVIHEQGTGLW